MEIRTYDKLPREAMLIRETVFTGEQGLADKPDSTDRTAVHFLMLDEDGSPIATCRIYKEEDPKTYLLGRLAVIKEYRGKHLGSQLMKAAEDHVRSVGGECLILHSQCSAAGFYKSLGYGTVGEPDEVQGHLHIWMKKAL